MPFATPLALAALVSLPALAAIYYLRNRYRREIVSSLMLWQQIAAPREGGARFERLQLPLVMLLELAALLMLVLAAAGPRVWAAAGKLPLVVILDDSASMHRSRGPADRALDDLLASNRFAPRYIVAGPAPQLSDNREAWTCLAADSNLDLAMTMAADLVGRSARILVVTDHDPVDPISPGRLQWWAFGTPTGNVGFITAHRTGDRCLVEIANFSDQPVRTTLGAGELQLPGSSTRTITLTATSDLNLRLPDDAFAPDNTVTLVRPSPRTVRVRIAVTDEPLAKAVRQALAGVPDIELDSANPDLLFTDAPGAGELQLPGAWKVQFVTGSDAVSYLGPFVVDRTHGLTDGLSLDGVIWGAPPAPGSESGRPIITAGNVVLVSETTDPLGRRDLRIGLKPEMSTLLKSPAWPILIYNAVELRRSALPGLARANIRVGESAQLTLISSDVPVRVTRPDQTTLELPGRADRLSIPAPIAGVYSVTRGNDRWTFAANMLSRTESDLRHASTGKWGDWQIADEFRWEFRDIAWAFGLAALALLTLHSFVVWRSGASRT